MIDIEEELSIKFAKGGRDHKGKFAKKNGRKKGNRCKKVANESISDGDFLNRNKQFLKKEALDTWNLGKILGLSSNGDEAVILNKIEAMIETYGVLLHEYQLQRSKCGRDDVKGPIPVNLSLLTVLKDRMDAARHWS